MSRRTFPTTRAGGSAAAGAAALGVGTRAAVATAPAAALASAPGDVVGKISVGYQGWFACAGDGAPINGRWHRSRNWGQAPSPSNNAVKAWPARAGTAGRIRRRTATSTAAGPRPCSPPTTRARSTRTAGPWETFQLVHNGNGTVSLKALANNLYVTADNAGASPLIADRTAVGTWGQFDLIAS
ncbi:fascin domain-containing protein [Actinacidiphila sp. ITFR-21]|uniref:fascin domain-containing protein n=1 Tax=Actinacidiphila sp. ITFR-21 TaxID=3075199 RepID=UPI0037D9E989